MIKNAYSLPYCLIAALVILITTSSLPVNAQDPMDTISALQEEIEGASETLDTLTSTVETQQENLTNLTATFNEQASTIIGLQEKALELEEILDYLPGDSSAVADVKDALGDLEGAIADQTEALEAINGAIADVQGQINEITGTIGEITGGIQEASDLLAEGIANFDNLDPAAILGQVEIANDLLNAGSIIAADAGALVGDITGAITESIPSIDGLFDETFDVTAVTGALDESIRSLLPGDLPLDISGLDLSEYSLGDYDLGDFSVDSVLSLSGLDPSELGIDVSDFTEGLDPEELGLENLVPEDIVNLDLGELTEFGDIDQLLGDLGNLDFDGLTEFTDSADEIIDGVTGDVIDGLAGTDLGEGVADALGGGAGGAISGFATGSFSGGSKHDNAFSDDGHAEELDQAITDNWIPAIQKVTHQLSTVAYNQLGIIGAFFDAKQQLETQLAIQEKIAEAHIDYHPSEEMCRIGTAMRSLSDTHVKARFNTDLFNKAMLTREVLSANRLSAEGGSTDSLSRLLQIRRTYCNPSDFNGNFVGFCPEGGEIGRLNNDINFTRTIDHNYTLNVDLTDDTLTPEEEDIIALSSNLYNDEAIERIAKENLELEYVQDDYQDTRSVAAIRGIARNSFSHMVGMKAQGSPDSARYLYKIVTELGVDEEQVIRFLGENPSYFAQMEVLTKKIYQDPGFYTNLYTKPANVERTAAALEAIGLMQNRDRYESTLRREMLVSALLELKVRDEQDSISNNLMQGINLLFIEE